MNIDNVCYLTNQFTRPQTTRSCLTFYCFLKTLWEMDAQYKPGLGQVISVGSCKL